MAKISTWSTTAASNNSAAPDGAPEGMSPASVNDVIRENMSAIAKQYIDQKGTVTTGGTTTAYTLTTNNVHTALSEISLFAFQVNAANTGAATLAVDGLTAKAMQLNGAAIAAGDLRADEIVLCVYNPDNDVFDIFKSGLNQDAIKTDTINEQTSAQGVTVDGVVLKDSGITATGGGSLTGTWSDLGTVTTVDINGGTIDGTTQATGTINGSIAAGGTWTAAATWTLPALTLGGTVTSNGQSFSGTIADLGTVTTVDINGGTIDGAAIGSGTVNGVIIGGSTPAAGTFTNLTASTDLTLASGATVTAILDEDDMTSNSATALITQQSAKAYVDATVVAIGALSVSGTPVVNDYARFTGAATIEGRSYSEAKTDFGFMTDLVDDTTPQLGGNLDGQDYTVSKVNLKDYGEVTNAIGSIGGGTQDIDLTLGNCVTATVDTSSTTFTFSNPTASDELCGFILYLTNGGSQTVTWPASVDWPGATAPTLTASGLDILVFTTIDGGSTWFGNLCGSAYA